MDEMITKLPALGTPEAAVQTCVNLIARATGQSEERLAYWLDLYYQVRSAYEAEEDRRQQEQRNMDMIRALCSPRMTGEPKASAPDQPEPPNDAPAPPADPEGSPPEAPTPKTSAAKGNPAGNSYGADAAAFKRETRERLLRLRAEGMTIGELEKVAPRLGHDRIMNVLEGKRMAVDFYRELAAVLDEIEQKKEGAT